MGFEQLAYVNEVGGGQRSIREASSRTSILAQMADSQIRHGIPIGVDYGTAILYDGMALAIAASGANGKGKENWTLVDWYAAQIAPTVYPNGTIWTFNYTYYSLDSYRFGNNILYWYTRLLNSDGIRSMYHLHPRNSAGGFWHRAPDYPNQIFYARYTSLFQPENTTAWDDILLQYELYLSHTRNDTLKLTNHGYDESRTAVWANNVTGSSPLVWDRPDGRFYSSLLECLESWPEEHEGRAVLEGYFRYLSEGFLRAQDKESGGWWLVMNPEYVDVTGNYIESSATAMFTHGMLSGIQLGLLDRETYLEPALKAYDLMVDQWVVDAGDGTLNWLDTVVVGSLGSNTTFQYYISVPTDVNNYKRIGPFMWSAYHGRDHGAPLRRVR
ncbi:family 105 glycoside hydrolase [Xylariaceae sp. FL0255]|nr:family 105 glycoside hydrolase [Xylariaceae sp. FL0255]